MAKSSGHFKKAKAHSEAHNSREEVPNYLLPSEYRTPNGRGSEFIKYHDPKEFFEQELAKKNATKTRGKRPKFENSVWEIEVNCNEVHTLEDGQKLAKDLEHLLSYTCCSVALHRDEGHMVKDKEDNYKAIHNYHFHLVFETYKDGIQYARQEHNKGIFKNELQDVIAQSLSMDRGETQKDREKRIAAKLKISLEEVQQQQGEKYKQYCERLDQIAQEKGIEDFNARLEIRPRKHIDSSEYRRVAQELENTKTLTREEVEQLFNEQLQNTQIKITELETEKSALESQNQTLEQQNSQDKKTISKLTNDKTVLSNNLSYIATELEVPKDGNDKFKLQDIKNKVKALNADNKLRKKDISTVCEMVRKASIGTGVPREFYRDLGAIKKGDVNEVQELQQALIKLLEKYESSLKNKDNEISDLKDKNTELSNQEPKEIIKTVEVIKEVPKEITKTVEVVKEVPREPTADEIKKTEPYQNLLTYKERLETEVKTLADSGLVDFAEKDNCFEIIDKVKTVLSNSQKPKEMTKTVTREMTEKEIKQSEPYQRLLKNYNTVLSNLKPNLDELNNLTFVTVDDLTPRIKSTKWGGFKEVVESPSQIAERINKKLKENKLKDILENDRVLKVSNTVLSKRNKKLETENNELKSWKEIGIDLLHNFGFYIEEKIPSIEDVKSTVKSFASRLFSAFMMNNDHDLDYVQNKIADGQEYKQAQIEKQQQKEQAKQQEQIEQQVDQALGFGAKPNANKDKEEQEHSHGMSL